MEKELVLASILRQLGQNQPKIIPQGTVLNVQRNGMKVLIAQGVEGFLSTHSIAKSPAVAEAICKHYAENFGTLAFSVSAVGFDLATETITLSARLPNVLGDVCLTPVSETLYDRHKLCLVTRRDGVREAAGLIGRVVPGKIESVTQHGVVLVLPGNVRGVALGFTNYEKDTEVVCRILDYDVKSGVIDVTLDPALVKGAPKQYPTLETNRILEGAVVFLKPTHTIVSVPVDAKTNVIVHAPKAPQGATKNSTLKIYVAQSWTSDFPVYVGSYEAVTKYVKSPYSVGPLPFPWKLTSEEKENLYSLKKAAERKEREEHVEMDDEREAMRKISKKKAREEAIDMIERARISASGAAFPVPQSEDDFERMVLASPQSSYLWTQYIAHEITQGKVESARKIAERALQAINVREAEELRNVWIAYLNVEFLYGTKESLEVLFRRAVQHSDDPQDMYMRLLDIYEAQNAGQNAYLLLRSMLIKFKNSLEVWVRYGKHLVRFGKPEQLKSMMKDVVVALPKRDEHSTVLERVGVSLYDANQIPQARAVFEGLIGKYPNKLDVWTVYLDKEHSVLKKGVHLDGAIPHIRNLYVRLTSLALPPKKMQAMLTRFMNFEKQNGSEADIEFVKQRAVSYVNSKVDKE
eukprot:PhF_6_TR5617/c0_g1_i1/m.8143/K14792/RRP5, PDCD11; rRNA biogenesis protein RRP5